MKRLLTWIEKNHIAILFTLSVITITSAYTYFNLPKDVFPKSDFPRFQVIADIGFASLEDTELNVTRPLEEALKTIPNALEVRSVTERGTSTIDIFLKWGTDLNQAFQFAQSKINQARALLPSNVSLDIVRMSTSAFPMSEYGVWSDELDLKQLYTLVRYSIIPNLIGIDGIYGIDVIGGEQPEIWVKCLPEKLIEYNIDITSVGTAIDNANNIFFIGNIIKDKNIFFAVGGNKLNDIETIKNIVIASRMGKPIYLKDIANINEYHSDIRRIVSINGHKGLFIDIRKQKNADALKVSQKLDAKFKEIQNSFQHRLHIVKWDLVDFITSSIQGILTDIFIGIIIILIIVYYVMNRFRYCLPIILVLPIVIIMEFLVLKLLGLTVNIMTLGGLSAALGIIADNAIVITENYIRFRNTGKSEDVLYSSMRYIVPVTIWATLVTIIVFIPLNILSGVPGLFFKPLAVTLSTTIIISLIMAVIVIPIFIKYFIESSKKDIYDKERLLFRVLKRLYLFILKISLKTRFLFIPLTIALIIAGIFLFLKIPTGFLPEWDEGDIVFDYIAPAGTSISGTDDICDKVEPIIKKLPEVKMYIRKTGTHLGTPFSSPNIGEIIILLNKDRKRSTFEIMDKLREDISKKIPELETDFHQMLPDRLGDLTGVAKPIVVNVIGNDIAKLWNTANLIKDKLEKIQGLNSVLVDMPPAQKEIKVIPNQEAVSLLGLSVNDVFHYSKLALYGEVVSNIQRGLLTVPIRQFYEGNYRLDMASIDAIPIYTPNGGILKLGKLADFKLIDEISEITHKNGSLVVSVMAEISDRPLSDVMKDINKALYSIKNEDSTIELGGNYKNQQTSFFELLFVLFVSIILIFGILLFIFESFRTALAVFCGTIASGTFVIFGLYLTGIEFDVSSFTGMITVMGIVVNNGILVIDFVERFRKEGLNKVDAIIEAGNIRFRPVLITNLAAIAGFMPMALNLGHGGEVLQPFSIAMISGLIGSMFFSLILMPVFYLILHRKR